MRIVKDPNTRKQEILDVALKVFTRKGYDKTTITDIAKELGISQGLCYRYYNSKEEIYDAALEEYSDFIVSKNLERYDMKGTNLNDQIKSLSGGISGYSDAERGQADLYALFHSEGNFKMHDQLFLKVGQKLIPFIKDILNEAKDRGEIQISDPEVTAYFFIFGQIGILMSNDISDEDRSQRIQECLIELLGLKNKDL